ncbi:hypothetical protein M0D46_18795 [Xanthomonas prunicola]|uniref:hypothetical protein n=1 Tax=Xanthomonas TaxID=338 RepID=UPI0015E29286|nr:MULTISPECIES: hypothetical protein [Xanthomonas]MDG4488804.1 hypothetical protein [Xanthomonas vesicatoria]UXA69055.1 hypothetical protein M0D46_18795 [Xanthomonas prunicola]
MTHHITLAIWLVLIVFALWRGLIGYVRYARRRVFSALDSDYRAAALVANAKRQVRRNG